MTPTVSVIVPAYRCAATVRESVRSALLGSVKEIEVLVVDEGSDEETSRAVRLLSEEDDRVRVVARPENSGVAEARNAGARQARADWLAFLDSDDVWEPEKLEKQLALAKKTGARFVYTGARCIDASGTPTGRFFKVPERVTYDRIRFGSDIICSTVLIDRRLYLDHPMMRSDLHEDFLCWLSVLKGGETAYGVTEPLIRYRISAGSKSGNKLKSAKMAWNTYRAFGFGFFRTLGCFSGYCLHGVKRYWL